MSALLDPALAFCPLRMRCETRLERCSMLAKAVPVRAAAIFRIVELNRIVLPAAYATDLVGAWWLLVQRDKQATWTWELASRRLARVPEETIRYPHMLNRTMTVVSSGCIPCNRARDGSIAGRVRLLSRIDDCQHLATTDDAAPFVHRDFKPRRDVCPQLWRERVNSSSGALTWCQRFAVFEEKWRVVARPLAAVGQIPDVPACAVPVRDWSVAAALGGRQKADTNPNEAPLAFAPLPVRSLLFVHDTHAIQDSSGDNSRGSRKR